MSARHSSHSSQASSDPTRPLWLCLHLPQLGLEIFTRSLSDGASSRPVVLIESQRIVQANACARARGLREEMSLATAESICSDLAIAWRDEMRELKVLQQLAFWAYRFTPRVSPLEPDGLLLEVAGSIRLFRGLDRLVQKIIETLNGMGYSAITGLAPTPLAASALARSGQSPDPGWIASQIDFEGRGDDALRSGWYEAVARTVRPILARLPLTALDRPRVEQEKFTAMGLQQLHELLRLPRGPLTRRFGTELPDHLDRLTGRKADPRALVVPPDTFSAQVHFLEDLEHQEALVFPMQRLAGELVDWLRLRQKATDQLQWILRHPAHGTEQLRVRFATPQREQSRMLEFSRLQLSRAPSLPAVASLELKVTALTDWEGSPSALFTQPGQEGHSEEDPALLVDMLRARLGEDVCCSVRPADDHRPERAWQPVLPAPPRASAASEAAGDDHAPTGIAGRHIPSGLPAGPRPLWLLKEPPRLDERDGVLYWHGPLTLVRGPERIDVGWWDDALPAPLPNPQELTASPRDYWVVRHRSGAFYWVFHDGRRQGWYLHGVFS